MDIQKRYAADSLKTAGIFALATIIGMLFRRWGFTEPNIVVVYIFAVLMTARITQGYVFGILASVIALLGFNYFFTVPLHTLAVNDSSYFTTFAIMTITALVTSTLTSKAKYLTREANEKEMESRLLYTLTSQLQRAEKIEDLVGTAAGNISCLLRCNIACAYFGENGRNILVRQTGAEPISDSVVLAGRWKKLLETAEKKPVLDDGFCIWPVGGPDRLLGAVAGSSAILEQAEAKKSLFHSMLDNVAIALDRFTVVQERLRDQEMIVRERDRANLLRAISHDLRTPLSGIMGTSEMLMDLTEESDERYQMMQDIYKDADWLYSLVNNILSLTRLQDGRIVIHKEMEALEEIIESAMSRQNKTRPDREIQVELPEEFYLVPMDGKLIEQVISNLLDNAVKHSPDDSSIVISAAYDSGRALVSVKDEGEGIADCDLGQVFQMFYTSHARTADARNGVGLGLAICETVVKAHGGEIAARNREDGRGAEFLFWLPLTEPKADIKS